jgi:1,4-dihydroxy-2-naphthoyl-CoA hydrolase
VDQVEELLRTSQAFDALLGLELLEVTPELVRGSLVVRPELLQPMGLVHGGVYASIAESLASRGTAAGVLRDGGYVVGLSNHTSFLRPVSDGAIAALARAVHRGRTTWVWDVELLDAQARRCAISRVTIAVRWQDAAQ